VEGLSVKCVRNCCFSTSTVWCDDGDDDGFGHKDTNEAQLAAGPFFLRCLRLHLLSKERFAGMLDALTSSLVQSGQVT
jgi:hypothetical protein